ncbi:BA75_02811T0 [Komagataella pastoris]|uniref:Telomerase reverse transcriptase n=1 Tax=Komagataella pastoris TaxID=4922 RepID=A0A1B2JA37_PICPA|nr:BA75_02811T0 [Komagataella pastoris]
MLLKRWLDERDIILRGFQSSQLKRFLNTEVEHCPMDINIRLDNELNQLSHNEIIDYVIKQLIKSNKQHCISIGYKAGESVGAEYYCEASSFQVNVLKSSEWRILHESMRSPLFIDLIINYKGFLPHESTFIQLFGPLDETPSNKNSRNTQTFRLRSLLRFRQKLSPIPETPLQLIRVMLVRGSEFDPNLEKARELCNKIHYKHSRCKYMYIYDSICSPIRQKCSDNFDYALDKKKVVKFVLVICDTIFPLELFGDKFNRRMAFKNISKFLLSSKEDSFSINDLAHRMKLNTITWLRNNPQSGDRPCNKQEFRLKQNVFFHFMEWLFKTFLRNLIASFFYIVERASSSEILYYDPQVWQKISKPYTDSLFSKTFAKMQATNPNPSCQKSILRILPKKHDFRPIAASASRDIHFILDMMARLRPTSKILQDLRPDCLKISPSEIPKTVYSFKQKLLRYHECLPQVYAIKFDIKNCFDSLPREKILQCCQKILPERTFFLSSSYNYNEIPNRLYSTQKLFTDVTLSSDRTPEGLIQRNKVTKLDRTALLEIIKESLDQPLVSKAGTYQRKIGVFQGHSLSSTFCDVVYDQLVLEYFANILKDENSLLMRFADDFLILSTSSTMIDGVRKRVSLGFPDYNAFTNKDKTIAHHDSQSFELMYCGVSINLQELTTSRISTDFPISNLPPFYSEKLFSKLLTLFRFRVSPKIIFYNPPESQWKTIQCAWDNIMLLLKKNKVKKFPVERFCKDCNEYLRSLNVKGRLQI